MNTSVPVVSEKYDEVVFTNPKLEFHNLLLSANSTKPEYALSKEPANLEYFRTYGDEEDVQRMLAAKQFLEGELRDVRDRLSKADKELDEIKTSLTLVNGNDPKPAVTSGTTNTKAAEGKAKHSKTSETKTKGKKSKSAASSEQGATKKAKVEPAKNKVIPSETS